MAVKAVMRVVDDSCPGALAPHHAADGELLRLRVPGGVIAPAGLRALGAASAEFGDRRVGLTSRGNVQIRGVAVADVAALVGRLRAAGLSPDAAHSSHERVRNILASPLSGRGARSMDDVDLLAQALDAELCARPGLAALPGRFLFALDDGSGDVAGEDADVLAQALGDGQYAVRLAGWPTGARVPSADLVAVLLAMAEGFLRQRVDQASQAWRIAELPDGGAWLRRQLLATDQPPEGQAFPSPASESPVADGPKPESRSLAGQTMLRPGLIEQSDGRFAVCAAVGLGLLDSDQVAAVAAAADLSEAEPDQALRITPWRRIVVRDLELPAALAARELFAAVGLIVTPDTAWSRITACAGRPGCAKSLTDVQADARAFAIQCDPAGPAVHWAGCERACGTPAGDVVRLLATPAGYRIHRADRLSDHDHDHLTSIGATP